MTLSKKQWKIIKNSLLAVVFSIVFELGMPHMSLAAHENWSALKSGESTPFEYGVLGSYPALNSYEMVLSRNEKINSPESINQETGFLPSDEELPVVSERWITVTAYSSDVAQTDSTPFTTAWQTPVRDGVVALNFLPKGTLVRFPDLYGDKIFVVEDRMNARYTYRADIWMVSFSEAKKFGAKYLRMEELGVQLPRDYVLENFEAAHPGKK